MGQLFGFLQSPIDYWPKPAQTLLQDIVGGPGFQCFDGGFLANGSGHDNCGNAGKPLPCQIQCTQAVESRQRIVQENQFGRVTIQDL